MWSQGSIDLKLVFFFLDGRFSQAGKLFIQIFLFFLFEIFFIVIRLRPFSCQKKLFLHNQAKSWTMVVRGYPRTMALQKRYRKFLGLQKRSLTQLLIIAPEERLLSLSLEFSLILSFIHQKKTNRYKISRST